MEINQHEALNLAQATMLTLDVLAALQKRWSENVTPSSLLSIEVREIYNSILYALSTSLPIRKQEDSDTAATVHLGRRELYTSLTEPEIQQLARQIYLSRLFLNGSRAAFQPVLSHLGTLMEMLLYEPVIYELEIYDKISTSVDIFQSLAASWRPMMMKRPLLVHI